MTWQAIRALRATPTGLATTDPDRRKTFVASLRQAEELADAAAAAGYAARPLPLFYALSQAGRAIAAAHLVDPWVLRGHGLSITPEPENPLLSTAKPTGGDSTSFRGVATATQSPGLAGPTSLGALWAANPDLLDVPIPTSTGQWPLALDIPIGIQSLGGFGIGPPQDPDETVVGTGGVLAISLVLPGVTGDDVARSLTPYPTLHGLFGLTSNSERAGPGDLVHQGLDGHGVERKNVGRQVPEQMTMTDHWRQTRELASIVEIDTRHPLRPAPHLIGYALPQLASGPCPHPLMLWWSLLLGLSSLARYEPAAWTAAIDLDTSELAVSLERVLDLAAHKVPERILEALALSESNR
jgi:hypothetical protein